MIDGEHILDDTTDGAFHRLVTGANAAGGTVIYTRTTFDEGIGATRQVALSTTMVFIPKTRIRQIAGRWELVGVQQAMAQVEAYQ